MQESKLNEDQQNFIKSDFGFAFSRAMFVAGELIAEGKVKEPDSLDEVEDQCIEIAQNWVNKIDIQNDEEEGYPSPYVRRKLIEIVGV